MPVLLKCVSDSYFLSLAEFFGAFFWAYHPAREMKVLCLCVCVCVSACVLVYMCLSASVCVSPCVSACVRESSSCGNVGFSSDMIMYVTLSVCVPLLCASVRALEQ